MARYRALQPVYIRKLIAAGEEFEDDGIPGRNWEPLDAEARAAVKKFKEANKPLLSVVDRIDPKRPDKAAIEIPVNWPELSAKKRRAIAIRLGAQTTITADEANGFIEAELERRTQSAA